MRRAETEERRCGRCAGTAAACPWTCRLWCPPSLRIRLASGRFLLPAAAARLWPAPPLGSLEAGVRKVPVEPASCILGPAPRPSPFARSMAATATSGRFLLWPSRSAGNRSDCSVAGVLCNSDAVSTSCLSGSCPRAGALGPHGGDDGRLLAPGRPAAQGGPVDSLIPRLARGFCVVEFPSCPLCLTPRPFLHRARARRAPLEGSSGLDRHGLNRWRRRTGRVARAVRHLHRLWA